MFRLGFLMLVAAAAVPVDYEKEFESFVKRFDRNYANALSRSERFGIFKANYMHIQAENTKGTNAYVLGVNDFTDLTQEEFSTSRFGFKRDATAKATLLGVHEYQGEALADSVDWRAQGAVTPVKNQGQCGSCWSFSTTGALEGAWKIAGHSLTSFSEEQFVQCDTGSYGCGGGSMRQAFGWDETQALCTEASYPYTSGGGTTGTCSQASCTVGLPRGGVTGYKAVAMNEQALMSAVSQQPVSIAVEADRSVFQSYKSGIMTNNCGTNLDHGILAVGYGTESGKDYWLVKNSWGTGWGIEGYGKLLRGKNSEGECGILEQTSYPVVTKAANDVVV